MSREEQVYAADLETSLAARERIRHAIHLTPLQTCSAIDGLAGRSLLLKCENLQKGGSFKMRGALNAVLCLPEAKAARGVITHSSGNFAQALALSARMRGIPATIVMPENAPAVKRRAVEGYGATVVLCTPTLEARESTTERLREASGATFLHPYNHADVIAGQGSLALELMEQAPNLDAVIVPVGGGGLVSGIALALKELAPEVRVFAAEPLGADDAARSKAAGERIPQTSPDTMADGLLTSLGTLTWPVIRDLVDEVLVVDDPAILSAMRLLWERAKLVVEPSGAVSVAAALSTAFRERSGLGQVAVVLSGGNVDLDQLPF